MRSSVSALALRRWAGREFTFRSGPKCKGEAQPHAI